jgi:chemotaxis protein methyltransferase CheR
VFAFVQREVLPALATGAISRSSDTVQVWSAGCASGEEAYTLAIMWQLELVRRFPAVKLQILATDLDDAMLARARHGCFAAGSLKELPERWRTVAFVQQGRHHCLRATFSAAVTIARQDIRSPPPDAPFDLVMCRNLAFTYFDLDLQRTTAARLVGVLRAGGALVLGAHEALPAELDELEPWSGAERIYRKLRSAPRI